jgi:hypothetical protein
MTWTNQTSDRAKKAWATMRANGNAEKIFAAFNTPQAHAKAQASTKRNAPFRYIIYGLYYQFYSDYAYAHNMHRNQVLRCFKLKPYDFIRLMSPIPNTTGRHCPEGIKL